MLHLQNYVSSSNICVYELCFLVMNASVLLAMRVVQEWPPTVHLTQLSESMIYENLIKIYIGQRENGKDRITLETHDLCN